MHDNRPSMHLNDGQTYATGGVMQREMPILGEVRGLEFVPTELLARCKHRLDAIRLCIQLSSLSHAYLAEQLNIDPGHFSRILSGQAHFPDTKTIELMTLCGNLAPVQFEMRALGLSGCEAIPKRRGSDYGGRRYASEARHSA